MLSENNEKEKAPDLLEEDALESSFFKDDKEIPKKPEDKKAEKKEERKSEHLDDLNDLDDFF